VDLAQEAPDMTPERRREIIHQGERAASTRGVRAGSRPPAGRHVSDQEVQALLEACAEDDSPAGVRDGAMIALAFSTGVRLSEISGLDLGDVTRIEGGFSLLIRHAKGDKTRAVGAFNGAAQWLRDWLAVRGDVAGALFLAIHRSGTIRASGMGTRCIHSRLSKRVEQAGVAHISLHDARRTFAGTLLDQGTDLVTLQKIMGHANPTTTAAYDRRPLETRMRALRAVNVWRPMDA